MWRFRTRSGLIISVILLIALLLIAYSCHDDRSPPAPDITPNIRPLPPNQPTRASKATNETDRLILSLFDSELDGHGLAFDQQLRGRYRNAYVGLYLLSGCNTDITQYSQKLGVAFQGEWAKQGLPTPIAQDLRAMQTAIIEEARSSYSMLYAATPCEKRNLPAFIRFFDAL